MPTNHLTMIEKVWPEFLTCIEMRKSPMCWEMSRFAIDKENGQSVKESISSFNKTTAEMFCGLTELCILLGIEEIYTLYNKQIGKLLRRLNCEPIQVSKPQQINGEDSFVGRFIPDTDMLNKLQVATETNGSLIKKDELPHSLSKYLEFQEKNSSWEISNVA